MIPMGNLKKKKGYKNLFDCTTRRIWQKNPISWKISHQRLHCLEKKKSKKTCPSVHPQTPLRLGTEVVRLLHHARLNEDQDAVGQPEQRRRNLFASPPSTSAISTNNSLAMFQLLPSVWMDMDLHTAAAEKRRKTVFSVASRWLGSCSNPSGRPSLRPWAPGAIRPLRLPARAATSSWASPAMINLYGAECWCQYVFGNCARFSHRCWMRRRLIAIFSASKEEKNTPAISSFT